MKKIDPDIQNVKVGDIIAMGTSTHTYEVTFVGKRDIKASHTTKDAKVRISIAHEAIDWTVVG